MAKTYKSTRKSSNSAVSEPIAAYGVGQGSQNSLAVLLQIPALHQPNLDLVKLTRKGIKKEIVSAVAALIGVNQEKMCELLHISTRTYQRLPSGKLLDIFSSEQTIEMARVAIRGKEVFDSQAAFQTWLHAPSKALNQTPPIDFLDTSFGIELVLDQLGRIEQGVFA